MDEPAPATPSGAPPHAPSDAPRPATWRALLAYARPHRRVLLLGGVLSLLGGLTGLAQPVAAKAIVDALGAGDAVLRPLLLLVALVVAGAVVAALGSYVLERTAESVVLAARRQLVGHLLRLRVGDAERTQPGDLLARVTSDTTLLRQVATQSIVQAVTNSLLLVGIVAMMAVLDPILLGVSAAVLVLIAAVLGVLLPPIQRATRGAQEAVGEMGSLLERSLGAFRTIKASGAERREADAVTAAATRAWAQGVRVAKWQAIVANTAGLAVQVAFLAVLGVGGARVADGAIPVSTLVAFLLYLFYLISPIGGLVQAATQFQAGAAALGRIDEVQRLRVEPVGGTPAGPVVAPAAGTGAPATVAFRGVRFRYRDGLPLIHDGVTFDAVPRGMTALVGPSGAGKSTVFSLIERFHDPEDGAVLVDGVDVRDWSLERLRAAIGYVEQDAPVLAGTLADNLRLAAPGATDAELHEALRRTRLDGLVARLPGGLDARVGHRGTTLSGGERQRVAIARALLRRPRLLLLDEATSQLDAANELALREVVADLARTTTVLVVAHRLSTVTMADRIVVMEAGRVRATGTHAELVRGDELYGDFAATQLLAASEAGGHRPANVPGRFDG